MRTTIAASLLSLLAFAAVQGVPLRSQSGGTCPNQRASFVPGADHDVPPYRTCYLVVHIGPLVIPVGVGRCPTGHTSVVAHNECLGQFGPGRRCEVDGETPVLLWLCRCVPYTGQGYSYSTCDCAPAGTMGFIPTGHSVECH